MSDYFLLRSALKDLLRPKKIVVASLLIALPSLAAFIQRAAAPQHPQQFRADAVYNVLCTTIVFGFVLVIMSVVFGTGVVSQEIEQKTIVYLLTRPVPRWRILLVKLFAALLAIAVTVCLSSTILALVTFGPGSISQSRLGRDLLILPIGALAYGAVFVLLATLLNRPLMYGLFFAFGWESWVPNMPGNFRKFSVMTYLRVLAPHPKPEAETIELSELLTFLNPQNISQGYAWMVLVSVIVIAILAAMILFSMNEYVPREDGE